MPGEPDRGGRGASRCAVEIAVRPDGMQEQTLSTDEDAIDDLNFYLYDDKGELLLHRYQQADDPSLRGCARTLSDAPCRQPRPRPWGGSLGGGAANLERRKLRTPSDGRRGGV